MRAVSGERDGVDVIVGVGPGHQVELTQLIPQASGEGMIAAVALGSKRKAVAADLAFRGECQGLEAIQANPEPPRIQPVGLVIEIGLLDGANPAFGEVVPSEEAQPLSGAVVDIGLVRYREDSQVLEE